MSDININFLGNVVDTNLEKNIVSELGDSKSKTLSQKKLTEMYNEGYKLIGVATPATTPNTLTGEEKVFYIATEEGTYHADFGIIEPITELTILRSDSGRWRGESLGAPTRINEKINELQTRQTLLENNVTSSISKQDSSIDMFQKSVKTQVDEYKPIEINGDVTNAADEEDLTSKNGLLQIKDRGTLYGKGYKILRRGVDLQTQFNQENTIYEIRYDFDLNGEELTIPSNCTLKFAGGKLSNGTIIGANTTFSASEEWIFGDISFKGTWANKFVSPIHFGAKSNETYIKDNGYNAYKTDYDSTTAFDQAFNSGFSVSIPSGAYYVGETINITKPITVECTGSSYGGVDNQFKKNKSSENTVIFSDKSGVVFNIKAVISWRNGIIDLRQSTEDEVIAFQFDASFGNWGSTIDTTIFGSSNYNLIGYKFNYDDDEISQSGYITYLTIKGFIYRANIGFYVPLSSPKVSNRLRWITGVNLLFDSRGCKYAHKLQGGELSIGGVHQAEHIFEDNDDRYNIAPTYIQGCHEIKFLEKLSYADYSDVEYNSKYTSHYCIRIDALNNYNDYDYSSPYPKIISSKSFEDVYNQNRTNILPQSLTSRLVQPRLEEGSVEFNEGSITASVGIKRMHLNSLDNNSLYYEYKDDNYQLKLQDKQGNTILDNFPKQLIKGSLVKIDIDNFEEGCYIYLPKTPNYKIQGILAINQKANTGIIIEKIEVYSNTSDDDGSNKEELVSTFQTTPYFGSLNNFYSKDLFELSKEGYFSFKLYLHRLDQSNSLVASFSHLTYSNHTFQPIGDYQPKGNYPELVKGSILNTEYANADMFFNTASVNAGVIGLLVKSDGKWLTFEGEDKQTFRYGKTKPAVLPKNKGFIFYREDSYTPLFWDGSSFRTYDGLKYNINQFTLPNRSGTFAQRPESWREVPVGYAYFCTDKQTVEGASDGIMIYHKGEDKWVDALGREIL